MIEEGGEYMYYCKNCGEKYMTDEAVMCVKCGAPKGQGSNFCSYCGKQLPPDATVCMNCGVPVYQAVPGKSKSRLAAGLLGIFLGGLGIHNFYLGYTSRAVVQLVLFIVGCLLSCIVIGIPLIVGVEIWGLVEGIMILAGKISADSNGMPLSE